MPRSTAELTVEIARQSKSVNDDLGEIAGSLPAIARSLEQMSLKPQDRTADGGPAREAGKAIRSARHHLGLLRDICTKDGPALLLEVDQKLEGQRFLYKYILRKEQRNTLQEAADAFRSQVAKATQTVTAILARIKNYEDRLNDFLSGVVAPVAPTLEGARMQLDVLKNRAIRLGEIGRESGVGTAERLRSARARIALADDLERDAKTLQEMLELGLAGIDDTPAVDPASGGLVPDTARLKGLRALRKEFDELCARRPEWKKQRDEDAARIEALRVLLSIGDALGPVEADVGEAFGYAIGAHDTGSLADAVQRLSNQAEPLIMLGRECAARFGILRTDLDEEELGRYTQRCKQLSDALAEAKAYLSAYALGTKPWTEDVAAHLSQLARSAGLSVDRAEMPEQGSPDRTDESGELVDVALEETGTSTDRIDSGSPEEPSPPMESELTRTVGEALHLLDDTQVEIVLREIVALESRGTKVAAELAHVDGMAPDDAAKALKNAADLRLAIASRTETLVTFAQSALNLAKQLKAAQYRPDLLQRLKEAGERAVQTTRRLRNVTALLESEATHRTTIRA
jgi:hypothetical protein